MPEICSQCHDYIYDDDDDDDNSDDDSEYENPLYVCEQCHQYLCDKCIPDWRDENTRVAVCDICELKFSECACEKPKEIEKVLCKDCTHPTPPQKDIIEFLLNKAGYDNIEAVHEEYRMKKQLILHKHRLEFDTDNKLLVITEVIRPKPNKRQRSISTASPTTSNDDNNDNNDIVKKQCL
jgi:hypothetical protein